MRLQPRIWFIISVLCFIGAIYFWRLGDDYRAKHPANPGQPTSAPAANPTTSKAGVFPLISAKVPALAYASTNSFPEPESSRFPNRLRNTAKPLKELVRSDDSLLLANALLDATQPLALPIPDAFRSKGEHRTAVVKAHGKVTDAFRQLLKEAGAEIVSYVPNNAFLIRLQPDAQAQLVASPLVQAVIPWEPYFKLEPKLLNQALHPQQARESELELSLLVFAGARDAVLPELAGMEVRVLGESRSYFGDQLLVKVRSSRLAEITGLDGVQWVEKHSDPRPANDLTRVTLGVSTNTITPDNYLNLTGEGVLVNVNDTGVDEGHPDLAGRVSSVDPIGLTDTEGHGTHVAGIIAGSGARSSSVSSPPSGSVTNADFRGKAPKANLFVIPFSLSTGPQLTDVFMQERAAATNALISNNSWGYRQAYEYDISAASFDAAVRDALPRVPGSQPITYVFSAANDGGGDASGEGGSADTITAPGTAKNVITVGAIESLRQITNAYYTTNLDTGEVSTNAVFYDNTDSSDQIASFSSRGNVGVGQEGDFGRFKPDVVAPGTFIVSTRSSAWRDLDPTQIFNYIPQIITQERVAAGSTNAYQVDVPADAVELSIFVFPNASSPDPFPDLGINVSLDGTSIASGLDSVTIASPAEGLYDYTVSNSGNQPVSFNVIALVTVTNTDFPPDYFVELKKLNDPIRPYRYESGTSMSAPAVTGMLALMQEFLQKRLGLTNPSPALLKAMLINGAQSIARKYDYQVNNAINFQGWGRPSITNSLPIALDGAPTLNDDQWPIRLYDQSPALALATGESVTRTLTFNDLEGTVDPLKVTLVWTDPPGNPAVGVKLVNDLDLIVTNLDSGEIFFGNAIGKGNTVSSSTSTNEPPVDDVVNNVENVIVAPPLSQRFSITVRAKRVNVNAVDDQTNRIAQDFALVISSAGSSSTNIFKVTEPPVPGSEPFHVVKEMTNGIPLIHERVAANPPISASTNGLPEQWNFYRFVNVGSTNPYVLIATVNPVTLSRPRLQDSDIDLYVTTNPAITNLDPAVIASADVSRGQGGYEFVTYSNSPPDSVYYIGIKSEAQQAAQYDLVVIASDKPFEEERNGARIVRLLPVPAPIPDGSNRDPKGVQLIGVSLMLGLSPIESLIRRVIVTNVIEFQNSGDLTTLLRHPGVPGVNQEFMTLSSHTFLDPLNGTRQRLVYDDSGSTGVPGSVRSEGPGRLTSLIGKEGRGLWQLVAFDNAPFHTATIVDASIVIQRINTNTTVAFTAAPFSWAEPDPVQIVPVTPDVVEAQFCVISNSAPLELYLGLNENPDRDFFYVSEQIETPGECLVLNESSSPILLPGKYIARIFNNNPVPVSGFFSYNLTRSLRLRGLDTFAYNGRPIPILDDAITTSTLNVTSNRSVMEARVGVRIDHERASDLVLSLISPAGTRLLLSENRGGSTATGYGVDLGSPTAFGLTVPTVLTNFGWATFTGNTNLAEGPIKFEAPPFRSAAPTARTVVFKSDFDLSVARVYGQSETVDSFFVETNSVEVLNLGAGADSGSRALALSSGAVSTLLPVRGGNQYELQFSYKRVSSAQDQNITIPVGALGGRATAFSKTLLPGVAVPKLRLAPGESVRVTVPGDVKISFDGGPALDADGNSVNGYGGLPRYALIGQWSYSAVKLDPLTLHVPTITNTAPFFIGTNAIITAPRDPGDYYLWLTVNAPNGPAPATNEFPVTLQWNPNQVDSFRYVLGGVTNTIAAANYWQTNSITFLASEELHDLSFLPDRNTTTLIDSVRLIEPINSVYYLSEESMEPLQGESAVGNWRLEIRDNRTGAVAPRAPQLISWYLQLLLAPSGQPIALTNSLDYLGIVRGGDTRYFAVNVPPEATAVTNYIADTGNGGGVEFFYSRDSVPVGTVPPDIAIGSGFVVDTTAPAGSELLPGGRYYLAVKNVDPTTSSNYFLIRADMKLPMITLQNGSPVTPRGRHEAGFTANFPAITNLVAVTNILYPGTNMHWYKYDLDLLPANASPLYAAVFQLQSTNRDLHLVVKHSDATVNYLPHPTTYDYHSIRYDTDREAIIVRTNSYLTPLTQVPWLIGVYNSGTNFGRYTVTGTRWTNEPPVLQPLPTFTIDTNWNFGTNRVAFSLAPGESQNYFYKHTSSATNRAMVFELLSLSGDADLLVRRDDLPSDSLFEFSDLQLGTNSEHVTVSKSIFMPSFASPTNYYLTLINHDTSTVTGILCYATASGTDLLPSGLKLEILPPTKSPGGDLVIEWVSLVGEKYEIQYSDQPAGTYTALATVVAKSSRTKVVIGSSTLDYFYRVVQVDQK